MGLRFAASMALAGAALLAAGAAAAGQAPEITEWRVPWDNTRPRDPYVGPDGRVWFVGQAGNYVGWLDSARREFGRHMLPAGTGPHNCIVDGRGVWVAGNRDAYIGLVDPDSGDVERFEMPDPAARDPHTLAFAPDGSIWFTVQGGNFVGHLAPSTGDIRLLEVPTPRARPYGIVVTDSGQPWFTEFGSNKLGTVDPKTLALREIELPRDNARPRRLGETSDGAIWYVDYVGGYLGRYDPGSGEIEEWPAPSGESSRPYGMVIDHADRAWFVETGVRPNRLVGFDTRQRRWLKGAEIGSGGGSVRNMHFDSDTRRIWFGTDTNTLGRATLP